MWHRVRGDDGGGGPINCVTTRHEAIMPRVGIKVCRVVEFTNCRWSQHYISDARKRIHGVIPEVYAADEAWSTYGPNSIGRVPRSVEQVEAFSAAIRRVG